MEVPAAEEHETSSTESLGPTICRTVLGFKLRQLREARGHGQEFVAGELGSSRAKLCRLELGKGACKESDVAAILTFYDVDSSVRDEIFGLVRGANAPAWWQEYAQFLPPGGETYVGMEQAASSIRSYDSQRIPELLRTPRYTRALGQLSYPRETHHASNGKVALLERRQMILTGPEPPVCQFLIDEAALVRPAGGAEVMQEQIEHLLQLHMQASRISLHVIPLHRGGPATPIDPFTLMTFKGDELRDLVCLEQPVGILFVEESRDVDIYGKALDALSPSGVCSHRETERILTRLLRNFVAQRDDLWERE